MYHMKLPNRLFFTGVPGSRWSGIAQTLEQGKGFNTSDRTPERDYTHSGFTGHKGAYFGTGMEFDSFLNPDYLDLAWTEPGGTKIVKSHDWAYKLDLVKELFPDDWIMLVYRPDLSSYTWWHEAGGFNIKYPNYKWYEDSTKMMSEIATQNKKILEFAHKQDLTWNYFTTKWVKQNFGQTIEIKQTWTDILVTVLK
jgi:hypothetical protein